MDIVYKSESPKVKRHMQQSIVHFSWYNVYKLESSNVIPKHQHLQK